MRIKLCDQYKTEREEICKKLIAIVGTEFYLSDLDEDIEKQNTILAIMGVLRKLGFVIFRSDNIQYIINSELIT